MLEELTKKIQKAVPSLLELKFGCLFINEPEERGIGYQIVSTAFFQKKDFPYDCKCRKEGTQDFSTFASEYIEENCKILGRPITLSDILIYIQKLDSDYPIHTDFFFDKNEKITITQAKGHPTINKECDWTLGKPLSEQSEETIKFLNTL